MRIERWSSTPISKRYSGWSRMNILASLFVMLVIWWVLELAKVFENEGRQRNIVISNYSRRSNFSGIIVKIPTLGILILTLGIACVNDWVERPVVVTRTEFGVYWAELERRWPEFFHKQCVTPPALPSMDDVFDMVTFLEVETNSHFPTCTYRLSSNEIRIGSDKWGSGCVAHEIGHAACDLLGLEVCRDFEHPEYESKC